MPDRSGGGRRLARDTIAAGRKLLLCGNGGSAADAQHIAAELVGRFVRERAPLPAIALTVDTSILTAVGNDYGFEHVFSRQVAALGAAGDLLVAISTSGKSPNVLAAAREARARGVKIIGMTGQDGGPLAELCDVSLRNPSRNTARIQECHITIGHLLCEAMTRRWLTPCPLRHRTSGITRSTCRWKKPSTCASSTGRAG